METSGGSVVQEMRCVTIKLIWITYHEVCQNKSSFNHLCYPDMQTMER